MTHTPAPWNMFTYGDSKITALKISGKEKLLAVIAPTDRELNDEDCANAKLIAASPLMLKGYEEILKIISGTDLEHGSIGMIVKTQIAQARG